MSANAQLSVLLGQLDHQTMRPLDKADAAELVEVALAAAELGDGASALADRVAGGVTSWASVWADPLSEGQAGLDLLAAAMSRAAWKGVARPLD